MNAMWQRSSATICGVMVMVAVSSWPESSLASPPCVPMDRDFRPYSATEGWRVAQGPGVSVGDFAAATNERMFVSWESGYEAWRTTNGGCSWESVLDLWDFGDTGGFIPYLTRIRDIIVSPGPGSHRYYMIVTTGSWWDREDAATPPFVVRSTVFVSDDKGASWAPLEGVGLLPISEARLLRVAPSNPKVVYLVAHLGSAADVEVGSLGVSQTAGQMSLYASDDGGQTWNLRALPSVPALAVLDADVDPTDPKTVWLGTGSGAFVTHDAGESWEMKLPDGSAVIDQVDISGGGSKVTAFRRGGTTYISFDGGENWKTVRSESFDRVRAATSGFEGRSLVISTGHHIYRMGPNLLWEDITPRFPIAEGQIFFRTLSTTGKRVYAIPSVCDGSLDGFTCEGGLGVIAYRKEK